MPKVPENRFPYETAWWTAYATNEGMRRLAYEILEANGVWHVRVLADANTGGPATLIEVDHPNVGEGAGLNLKIPKSFVLQWLSWHARQDARAQVERQERMVAATRAAARAAKGAKVAAWAAAFAAAVSGIGAGFQAYYSQEQAKYARETFLAEQRAAATKAQHPALTAPPAPMAQ